MLYRAFLILLVLVIAIGGGAGSLWLVLEKSPLGGSLASDPWVAFPVAGTPQADPYSRARHVRTGKANQRAAENIAPVSSTRPSRRS